MSEEYEVYEYQIAGAYLCAMINDDYSGLGPEDEAHLTQFMGALPSYGVGAWEVVSEEPHFAECDVCGLHGDVYDVNFVVFK